MKFEIEIPKRVWKKFKRDAKMCDSLGDVPFGKGSDEALVAEMFYVQDYGKELDIRSDVKVTKIK